MQNHLKGSQRKRKKKITGKCSYITFFHAIRMFPRRKENNDDHLIICISLHLWSSRNIKTKRGPRPKKNCFYALLGTKKEEIKWMFVGDFFFCNPNIILHLRAVFYTAFTDVFLSNHAATRSLLVCLLHLSPRSMPQTCVQNSQEIFLLLVLTKTNNNSHAEQCHIRGYKLIKSTEVYWIASSVCKVWPNRKKSKPESQTPTRSLRIYKPV